jgi:hypothetical protein
MQILCLCLEPYRIFLLVAAIMIFMFEINVNASFVGSNDYGIRNLKSLNVSRIHVSSSRMGYHNSFLYAMYPDILLLQIHATEIQVFGGEDQLVSYSQDVTFTCFGIRENKLMYGPQHLNDGESDPERSRCSICSEFIISFLKKLLSA